MHSTCLYQAVLLVLCVLAATFISYSQPCQNLLLNQGNVGVGTTAPLNLFHVNGVISSCPDPTFRLTYGNESELFRGTISILTPSNLNLYTQLPLQSQSGGDFVIAASSLANDLILTTRSFTGNVRLATTETLNGSDLERLTITPAGKIGIWNPIPKNLFSVRLPVGIDYWSDNEQYQDIRFNCYHTPNLLDSEEPDSSSAENMDSFSSGHKNIMIGYSGIIQARNTANFGSMLLAVAGKKDYPDTDIDFFEHIGLEALPKGIMLLNFFEGESDYTNTAIASQPESLTRLIVRGRTNDDTKNVLRLKSANDATIFEVRNNGNVGIGVINPGQKLVVNGKICAKEVIVQLSGELCWGDYVFEEDYKLMPLEELERWVKKEKHLPGIPKADEIDANGIQLGELQTTLVKKIEELTLYLFELKNENKELQQRINQLEHK